MPTLQIPHSLSVHAGHQESLALPGGTVRAVLTALRHRYPELGRHLMGEDGEPRRYVSVYVNETDIRSLQGVETAVTEGDTLMVVPSIAGG